MQPWIPSSKYPFQIVRNDYFAAQGYSYLAYVVIIQTGLVFFTSNEIKLLVKI